MANILPITFEKDKPIFIELALRDQMEFTYLGNEEVTLASGAKLVCAKMRMARVVDGYLQDVDFYWFCNKRGWVASVAMDGTWVQVLK